MNAIQIRPATPEDLPKVAELLRNASLPVDGLDEQFGPAYAVAVAAGTIVGVEGIERYGDAGLLRSAAVSPDWRGKGIGESLTRDRLAWAAAEGITDVWLLTTTADRWFPKFGFALADRASAPPLLQGSREFAEACPATAIAMRRSSP
jgi:amino-acid N-acetyltransferase